MEEDSGRIEDELEQLKMTSGSDFCAIARMENDSNEVEWKYAVGYRNLRYRYMKLRWGKGLAGLALRIGRPVIIDARAGAEDIEKARSENPIMLSENLQAVIAVPLISDQGSLGLLLIGSRYKRRFEKIEIVLATQAAERLVALMNKEKAHSF